MIKEAYCLPSYFATKIIDDNLNPKSIKGFEVMFEKMKKSTGELDPKFELSSLKKAVRKSRRMSSDPPANYAFT